MRKNFIVVMLIAGAFLFARKVNAQTWTQKNPTNHPSARYLHTMAYDSESDRVVLFGGTSGSSETWEYDLNSDTWIQKSPATGSPSWRKDHIMAYDSESDRIVLFGGFGAGGPGSPFGDTWEYDLNTDTWTQYFPSPHPAGRYNHGMAYDSESDRIVLFGGETASSIVDDTWEYDVNAHNWIQKSPSSHPSIRQGHAMAYDSQSDRIVLFGGWLYPNWYDETWEYNLNTDTWVEKSPSIPPPGRKASAMVYDSQSDRAVLFGGMNSGVDPISDTWEYDLGTDTWVEQFPSPHPAARWGHAMAYDSESNRTVLFGGLGPLDDTWEYWADYVLPMVTVLYPNGGENFVVGDTCDITWIATDNFGVDSISIFYTTNAGGNWDTIATGEPNDSLYEWIIPSIPSDSCLVKILAYDPSLNIGEDQSDSLFSISSVGIEENISSPSSFVLFQISPNPFSEKVKIELGMQSFDNTQDKDVGYKMEDISLLIFDVTGRKVREFILYPSSFILSVTWDGRNNDGKLLPSGIYYCRLSQGSYTETRKILLVR